MNRTALIERNKAQAIGFDNQWMPEPNTGCWLWLGAVRKFGHGWSWDEEIGRADVAHRISWRRKKGPIPPGMCVLHRCDVACCINPDHLFLGTRADNIADMIAKGRDRHLKGEHHPLAKLTEESVAAIRLDTRTQETVAVTYGISQSHVSSIKLQRSWKGKT
jgi:hypothetical protein